jgi:hypothetical protein
MAKGTGKPCGASYIANDRFCRMGVQGKVGKALGQVRKLFGKKETESEKGTFELAPAAPAAPAETETKRVNQSARSFDAEMEKEQLRRDGDKTFDKWDETTGPGATRLGQGLYGTVMKSEDGTYAVKRGDISDTEAKLIQKLGENDLGPILIAADVDGPGRQNPPGVEGRRGRIAMSIVDGEPIGDVSAKTMIAGSNVVDIYWSARAKLHRMGIAHNDLHIENVLVDKNGKGRIVDMGLAQENPKAAFSEAIGAFLPPKDAVIKSQPDPEKWGDRQLKRYNATGGALLDTIQKTGMEGPIKALRERSPLAFRALTNLKTVQSRMEADGLTRDEIAEIMVHGIRKDLSTYSQGVWQRITDQQAMEYINTLYDGI